MTLYEVPSLVALIFKAILLAYVFASPHKTGITRVLLWILIILSLFNLVEFAGLTYYALNGFDARVANFFGFTYLALFIPCLALLLHVSLELSFDTSVLRRRYVKAMLYAPVVIFEFLLLFTDKLVLGFKPFLYTILRDPGPWYFLFESFAVLYCLAALANLVYGARSKRAAVARTRNRLWLVAVAPMALLIIYLIVANHFGWTKLTSTFYFPIAMTFFLVVTTYATHHYRLFEVEFYIPWSHVRKRKTAFYDRIRAMIAEIADLGSGSVNRALQRLAETLRCPVAFVDDTKTLIAAVGGPQMAAIPLNTLKGVDHILVANEIAESQPQTYAAMKRHGIAAIVPFHPHSHSAASWLLLGDAFSDEVYTARDFRLVEQLFDKMADLFLDKLVQMRTKLADAQLQAQTLKFQLEQAQVATTALEQRVATLARDNLRLVREQTADSLLLAPRPTIAKLSISLLGWNKNLRQRLRARFPQLEHYAGPDSASFRRRPLPDVLICEVQTNDRPGQYRKLAELISGSGQQSAVLLMGSGAGDFAMEYRKHLLGKPVEVLPATLGDDAIERRLSALVRLRESLFSASHADFPLLGVSHVYVDAMAQLHRIARFAEPIGIRSGDTDEAIAVAAYIHQLSECKGEFRVLRAAQSADGHTEETIAKVLDGAESGTLMIDRIAALANETWDLLLAKTNNFAQVRLIAGCSTTAEPSPLALFDPLRPIILELPTLRERRDDLPLLVHYYTLQYNLQSGLRSYLSQSDVDELISSNYPVDLFHLKSTVFTQLEARAKSVSSAPDLPSGGSEHSLAEYVAEYEKRLIEQTLQRCDGNKSKAARLLGLRPNTLHYKLERYGLLKEKE